MKKGQRRRHAKPLNLAGMKPEDVARALLATKPHPKKKGSGPR